MSGELARNWRKYGAANGHRGPACANSAPKGAVSIGAASTLGRLSAGHELGNWRKYGAQLAQVAP